jgi:hypothetical protein
VARIVGQGTTAAVLDPQQFEGFEVRHGKTLNVACKLQPQLCYEHHGATDTLDWNKSLSSWLG